MESLNLQNKFIHKLHVLYASPAHFTLSYYMLNYHKNTKHCFPIYTMLLTLSMCLLLIFLLPAYSSFHTVPTHLSRFILGIYLTNFFVFCFCFLPLYYGLSRLFACSYNKTFHIVWKWYVFLSSSHSWLWAYQLHRVTHVPLSHALHMEYSVSYFSDIN